MSEPIKWLLCFRNLPVRVISQPGDAKKIYAVAAWAEATRFESYGAASRQAEALEMPYEHISFEKDIPTNSKHPNFRGGLKKARSSGSLSRSPQPRCASDRRDPNLILTNNQGNHYDKAS